MNDEPTTLGEQPLIGGHLPFREMGITPPPPDKVLVSIKKVITSNTRRNPREIMVENIAFDTTT